MLLNLQNSLTSLSRVRGRWLIARSRIFDRKWYQAEYPESGVAGLDPIMHYLLSGADRGYRPIFYSIQLGIRTPADRGGAIKIRSSIT